MPHRNLLALCFTLVAALACWAARDHSRHGRRLGHILDRVVESYIDPLDSEVLFEAALEGMLGTLDEHSRYVRPSDRALVESALDQEFGGIGIEVGSASPEGHPVVKITRSDSPAMRAGINAGDRIVSVDGRSTRGLPLGETIGLLRGSVGTPVRVSVLGPGSDSSVAAVRTLELVRERVLIETVLGDRLRPDGRWEFRLEGRPSIGYVRISSFGERTAEEVVSAVTALATGDEGPGPITGLVLDLRGNPGGLLSAAVEVCDLFLGDRTGGLSGDAGALRESARTRHGLPEPGLPEPGLIVSTHGRDGRSGRRTLDRRLAGSGDLLPDTPLAVLVDGGTASAAEIVAACLQDHRRGSIVGGRTFGKGTVQQMVPLEEGGLLKLTTAQYFRPSGRPIHRPNAGGPATADARSIRRTEPSDWGVTPDPGCVVEPPHDAVARMAAWRQRRDSIGSDSDTSPPAAGSAADLPEQVDPVLARALEALEAGRPNAGSAAGRAAP
jgi:carboxyl-terminal processing protease